MEAGKSADTKFLGLFSCAFLEEWLCCSKSQSWKFEEAIPIQEIADMEVLSILEETQNQIFPDGSAYQGKIRDGMWNGTAIYITKDGSYFKGKFVDNKREGRGLMISIDGHRYEGEWQEDQPGGKGKMTFSNGDSYEGSFSGGLFHGKGTYRWADGHVFEGIWEEDKIHGDGSFTSLKYDFSYKGEWRRDMPCGSGTKVEGERLFEVVYDRGNIMSYSMQTKPK